MSRNKWGVGLIKEVEFNSYFAKARSSMRAKYLFGAVRSWASKAFYKYQLPYDSCYHYEIFSVAGMAGVAGEANFRASRWR